MGLLLTILISFSPGDTKPKEVAFNHVLSIELESASDTCISNFAPPLNYYQPDWQTECEATYCDGGNAYYPWKIYIVWYNYDSLEAHSKTVRIYLWSDAGGEPGEVLWSREVSTGEVQPGYASLGEYEIDTVLFVDSPVWFGHRELEPGPPTSLFDLMPQVPNKYSATCSSPWYDDFDHFQILEYTEEPQVNIREIFSGKLYLSYSVEKSKVVVYSSSDIKKIKLFDVTGRGVPFSLSQNNDNWVLRLKQKKTGIFLIYIQTSRGNRVLKFLNVE